MDKVWFLATHVVGPAGALDSWLWSNSAPGANVADSKKHHTGYKCLFVRSLFSKLAHSSSFYTPRNNIAHGWSQEFLSSLTWSIQGFQINSGIINQPTCILSQTDTESNNCLAKLKTQHCLGVLLINFALLHYDHLEREPANGGSPLSFPRSLTFYLTNRCHRKAFFDITQWFLITYYQFW